MFEIVITVNGESEKYFIDRFPATISHSPAVSVVITEAAQHSIRRNLTTERKKNMKKEKIGDIFLSGNTIMLVEDETTYRTNSSIEAVLLYKIYSLLRSSLTKRAADA